MMRWKSAQRTCATMLLMLVGHMPSVTAAAPPSNLNVWTVDPLVKVFRDAEPGSATSAVADVARGEVATFQLIVRGLPGQAVGQLRCRVEDFRPVLGSAAPITGARVRFVGYVPVDVPMRPVPSDQLRKPPVDYPDTLLEQADANVAADEAQPIWITLKIPLDAEPATYQGTAVVTTSDGAGGRAATTTTAVPTSPTTRAAPASPNEVRVPLVLNVYPPKVVRTRLWVTNWFQRDRGFTPMPEYFTPGFWEMLRVYARNMAEHRQTVARTVPLELVQYSFGSDGKITFDWSRMDRWVQIFIDEGVIGRIEGQQIGWRGTKKSPMVVSTYVLKDGVPTEVRVDPLSPEAEHFHSQFLPALQQHIIDKGWLDIWMQHVADEPTDWSSEKFHQIAALMRKHAPRLRLMDALLTVKGADALDVVIPRLDGLHNNAASYFARQAQGAELWYYTAGNPQGEYANRHMELPLMKPRLLSWINYRYNLTGYLHWGYNFWGPDAYLQPTVLHPPHHFPAGNGWVVYPKKDTVGVIDSIRWEALRDGITDHELLSQLGERYPDAAQRLAGRHVLDFDRYDTDVERFRQTRRELLQLLSR